MSTALAVMGALFTDYTGLSTELQVFRGKYVTVPDGDFLTVGWTPTSPTGAVGTLAFATEENGDLRTDVYTVPCYLETMGGDTDDAGILAREQRLSGYWEQIQALHVGDSKLGGAVGPHGYAELGQYTWLPDQNAAGFVVGIAFNVNVQSLI